MAASKSSKSKLSARAARRPVDKFQERRDELATAALKTLSELGYARTSLREIAQNTEFSLGVIHYYFADKVELITYCVRSYKAECVKRYDQIVATAKTAEQLRKGFAAGMADTLRADGTMHRLWYDLRTQSMFEKAFKKDVQDIDGSLSRMIWRIVTEYARLSNKNVQLTEPLAYALFDGLFQHALLHHFQGDKGAAAELTSQVERAMADHVLEPGRGVRVA